MKIQTKIALLFASLAGGLLLAMNLFLYYLTNQHAFEDFYKRLEIRAIVAAKAQLDRHDGQVYLDMKEQHLEQLPGQRELILPVQHGRAVTTDTTAHGLPAAVLQQAIRDSRSTWRKGTTFYYVLYYISAGGDHLVIVSAQNEMSVQYLSYLRRALLISFFVAIALAFTIGLFFSKSILKPIRDITARVRSLSADNLHLRLDMKHGSDEVSELSATFNNMLDRLETAFETQNNFVSHASHEFNTPLTSIMGEAEYALARPRTDEQYRESIANIYTAAGKLAGITRSLLQLAQTGLTGKTLEMTSLRIDELLQKVRIMTDDIMPGNHVSVNYSLAPADIHKLSVSGNEVLLELAITNLVLNACKYSSNKPVQLALAATHTHAIIIVRDEGIGIPKDELKYIFDPFFRASNTEPYKGYGIGLPLTRNIIRIHRGELHVFSEQHKGTEIQVILPLIGERKRP